MARRRTGTLALTPDGRWQPIITLLDGSRVRLDPFPKGTSEETARDQTALWAVQVVTRGVCRPDAALAEESASTSLLDQELACDAWVAAWHAHRSRRGMPYARETLAHYQNHIRPLIGHKHIRDWTEEDLGGVVEAL